MLCWAAVYGIEGSIFRNAIGRYHEVTSKGKSRNMFTCKLSEHCFLCSFRVLLLLTLSRFKLVNGLLTSLPTLHSSIPNP